jgi:hypothetical protein
MHRHLKTAEEDVLELKAKNNKLKEQISTIDYEFELLKQEKSVVKAEARKEFAEELIENSEWIPLAAMPDRFITVKRINELLKEKESKEE